MVHITFRCSDQFLYYSGDNLTTTRGLRCLSTKSYTKGKWYAEITHFNGTNAHFFGLYAGTGYFVFYPEKQIDGPRIYMSGCFSNNSNEIRITIPISLADNHTVGIAVNIDDGEFTVFYENSFYSYSFSKDHSFYFLTGGGDVSDSNDLIQINSGEKPFVYNVPSLPLISSLYSNTVEMKNYYYINPALIYILIIY